VKTQTEKGTIFRALHEREEAFVIPNPWDIGTTRLLELLGFQALATTSAGYAFSTGRSDHAVAGSQMIAHVSKIASATDLPVSADLENGYGDAPECIANTVQLAAAAGVVGGSIEDATGRIDDPIYDVALAAERIRAASEVARALEFSFTLTARAENYLHGRPNLKDTISRLQAYQEAGADVLYAPGLTRKDDIAAVIRAVDRPLNVVMGLEGIQLSVAELAMMGVRRVSVGSALCRVAMRAFLRAAEEMAEHGTFTFAKDAVGYQEMNDMFETDMRKQSDQR
jgi:2-methylisocitrate lyase-like PEP mutase family enzyme